MTWEEEEPTLSPSSLSAIRLIALGFRAGLPLRTVLDTASSQYGTSGWSCALAQRTLLSETLSYVPPSVPPSFTFGTRRQARFVRVLLDEVDHTPGAELDETLVYAASSFCVRGTPALEPSGQVCVVFQVPKRGREDLRQVTLRVSELFSDIGHRVWEAAVVLHGHAMKGGGQVAKLLAGSVVLELGAGTGLSAVAYEELGVRRAVLTDFDEGVVSNLRGNVDVNVHERKRFVTAKLDVADKEGVREVADQEDVDAVVAADVTYDPGLMREVIATFESAVHDTHRVGLLLATSRNENSNRELDQELEESGMVVERVEEKVDMNCFDYLCGWDLTRVRLFKLSSKRDHGCRCTA